METSIIHLEEISRMNVELRNLCEKEKVVDYTIFFFITNAHTLYCSINKYETIWFVSHEPYFLLA